LAITAAGSNPSRESKASDSRLREKRAEGFGNDVQPLYKDLRQKALVGDPGTRAISYRETFGAEHIGEGMGASVAEFCQDAAFRQGTG